MSANVMTGLEAIRDALAAMSSITFDESMVDSWLEYYAGQTFTCRIGLEANITPEDYPIIRIVPSKIEPYGAIGYRNKCEALVYFGTQIQPFDDAPDGDGRVRLEKLYAALFKMDAAIRDTIHAAGGQCFETTLDEDRLDTYKLMAVRFTLVA